MGWVQFGSLVVSEAFQNVGGLPNPIFRLRHEISGVGYARGEMALCEFFPEPTYHALVPIYPREEIIQYQFGLPYGWTYAYPSFRASILNPGTLVWTVYVDIFV